MPDTMLAIHSLRNTGFCSEIQREVLLIRPTSIRNERAAVQTDTFHANALIVGQVVDFSALLTPYVSI